MFKGAMEIMTEKTDLVNIAISIIKKIYQCPVCPKTYETYSGIRNHIIHDHYDNLKELLLERLK